MSSTPKVLLNDFTRQWRVIEADVLATVQRVGASGWYILGSEVRQFEDELARVWGVDFTVGVGNGLDALEIALRCAGLQPGEKVLTTPLSAFATTLAIVRAGGIPVFVDVDESGLLDLELCHRVLSRDPLVRWLLPVHLYGHALDLEALDELRERFEVSIVEDCAQSALARSRGRATGTVGCVAATSFYPTKNLGALGDGGAVLTCEKSMAERARALRHYGQTATYIHDYLGLNSRLDELHAAVLRSVLLPRLPEWTARRRAIAAAYRHGITQKQIILPILPAGSESVWHLFPVVVAPSLRSNFVEHLQKQGVHTGAHYPRLIPHQRALLDFAKFEVIGELPIAQRFALGEVSIPIHPFLSDEEVTTVIDACNSWRPE